MQNTSKTYSEKLKDPRWQKKRLEILERDEWSCRVCLNKNRPLHVHHSKYKRGASPWEYSNNQLFTFCDKHHKIIHEHKIPFIVVILWLACLDKIDKNKLDAMFEVVVLNLIRDMKVIK